MSRLRLLLCSLAPLLLSVASAGRAQTLLHRAVGQSSVTVEEGKDGWTIHQRTVRLEPYEAIPDTIIVGGHFAMRLATVTQVVDGADDPERKVEVTIDDISAPGVRRVTAFSDVGADGVVAGGRYFITHENQAVQLNHVRNIETGKALFTSTGAWEAGMAQWLDPSGLHPGQERWVAFEALLDDPDASRLGYLRYGGPDGAITTAVLSMDPARQPEEFQLGLGECGALRWRLPGKAAESKPDAGACAQNGSYFPIFLGERPAPLGGVEVELSYEGKVYAVIPVSGDRLDIAHAVLEPGMTLTTAR